MFMRCTISHSSGYWSLHMTSPVTSTLNETNLLTRTFRIARLAVLLVATVLVIYCVFPFCPDRMRLRLRSGLVSRTHKLTPRERCCA